MEETTVLGQICQLLGVKRLAEWGEASGVNRYSKGLTVERLLFVLVAAQLRGVASLRDAAQLCAEDEALRDTIGLRDLGRSTLSDALARFPAELFERLFREAAETFARRLRSDRGKVLMDVLTLLDSTTVTVPLADFPWAKYNRILGAFKAHMTLELAGEAVYPRQIILTHGKVADISVAKAFVTPSPDSILVADRGYEDKRFFRLCAMHGTRFVIRAKSSTYYYAQADTPAVLSQGALADEIVVTRIEDLRNPAIPRLRRIVLPPFDKHEKPIILLTDLLDRTATEIGAMYRKRWQIELFFRFLKSQLRITKLYGCSENAIRIQLAVAGLVAIVIAYLTSLAEQARDSLLGPTACLRRLRYCLLSTCNLAELLLRTLRRRKRLFPTRLPPLIPPIQLELPLAFS